MVLTVFFSSRISPLTSTVIFRDRSPRATAVVTSAMFRTWEVRLSAMMLTLSVRSLQVPATPLTTAFPPRRPSVPTSRATRVTSEANEPSWSTMVLTVFFSSRISPLTSTVIFRDRSPRATAVVTSAMFRTWEVRLSAMMLTLSVRSFQVPATPRTSAWPPSLPSVPTSRATRVTSEANEPSWSTMVLTVFFSSRISPLTSTVTFFDRSPLATALVTSAMLRTWPVRLPAMELTLSVRSFQVPATPRTSACPPSLPSVPTSRATRVTSEANEPSWSTIVLTVFFSSRISPLTSTVTFFDRSPLATALVTSAMLRTWPVRLPAMELTLSVRSFQVPATPAHLGLSAQLALGADLAGHPGDLRGERAELVDHGVDGAADPQERPPQRPAVDRRGHLLGQVPLGDGADDAGHLQRRFDQVADQRIDGMDAVGPPAGGAPQRQALIDLAFLPDRDADPVELGGRLGELLRDVVEGFRDRPGHPDLVHGEPDREIAPPEGPQGAQDRLGIEDGVDRRLRVGGHG